MLSGCMCKKVILQSIYSRKMKCYDFRKNDRRIKRAN